METLCRQLRELWGNLWAAQKRLWIALVVASVPTVLLAGDRTVGFTAPAMQTQLGPVEAASPASRDVRLRLRSSSWANCGAIQAAIDALPDGGGVVTVPIGTFQCSTSIVIAKDRIELRGWGQATVLRLADGAQAPVLVIGDVSPQPTVVHRHIRVADLAIDGNFENQAYECDGGACDATHFMRNNGITIRGCEDVTVENVHVRGARSGGLVTEKGCRRVTVRGFSSTENYYDGLAGYETEDSVFTGLFLHDNGARNGADAPRGAGLSFDHRFDANLLTDVVISNSGTVGVFMRDSHNNVFAGLQVVGSGQYGVFLAQGDGGAATAATGNTFQGLTVRDSAWAGFRVNDDSCTNNLVSGAQFAGNTGCLSEAIEGLVLDLGTVCR
jgi:hypothetical protein